MWSSPRGVTRVLTMRGAAGRFKNFRVDSPVRVLLHSHLCYVPVYIGVGSKRPSFWLGVCKLLPLLWLRNCRHHLIASMPITSHFTADSIKFPQCMVLLLNNIGLFHFPISFSPFLLLSCMDPSSLAAPSASDPCNPNPCQNSGICFIAADSNSGGFFCSCTAPFSGNLCEIGGSKTRMNLEWVCLSVWSIREARAFDP